GHSTALPLPPPPPGGGSPPGPPPPPSTGFVLGPHASTRTSGISASVFMGPTWARCPAACRDRARRSRTPYVILRSALTTRARERGERNLHARDDKSSRSYVTMPSHSGCRHIA